VIAVAFAAASVLGGGCAHLAREAGGDEADTVVVESLVGVLAQALDPVTTTVQVSRGGDDPTTRRLVDALAARGFGIQRVAADQGAHFLEHDSEREPLKGGDSTLRWRVALGPVEVRRDFTLGRDGTLATASPIRLTGVRTELAADTLDHPGLDIADAAHQRVDYVAGTALDMPAPIIALVTPEIVERTALDLTRVPGGRRVEPRPSVQGLNASRVETGNLFYDATSNFGSTLDGLERVERRVVVFADDSLVLGPANRRMIVEFVERDVTEDDLLGLVGCSNGPTRLEIGNEGLALGRAARVVEELIALGIARERIFDEGCWAPVSVGERFPGRGVVIELWRAPA